MKFRTALMSLLMIVAGLFVLAPNPASASCVSTGAAQSMHAQVLDDEADGPTQFYAKLYFYDCGNYRTLRYAQIGYLPYYSGDPINCGDSLGKLARVRMNLGPIADHNPGDWEADCQPWGNSKIYDWANHDYYDWWAGDRCAGTHWTAVFNYWPDQGGDVPAVCF